MNTNDYIPSEGWMQDAKHLLKNPKVLGSIGILGLPMVPLGVLLTPLIPFSFLVGPFIWYPVWLILIKYFIDEQKKKKIRAIMDGFAGRYNEDQLNEMYVNNKQEFNRLFKLSSDEFFNKFIQEQADHKKAQEIIVLMQQRIVDMKGRLDYMKKREDKHKSEIEMLRDEIRTYEEILDDWKRKAA
jgi:succinate dehydrogenase flavin-adding protein (antitoxin of CptAB toxin-antitoxin module)